MKTCAHCKREIDSDESYHELTSGKFRCLECYPFDGPAVLRTVHARGKQMVDLRRVPGKREYAPIRRPREPDARENTRGESSPERPEADSGGAERSPGDEPEGDQGAPAESGDGDADKSIRQAEERSFTDLEVIKLKRLARTLKANELWWLDPKYCERCGSSELDLQDRGPVTSQWQCLTCGENFRWMRGQGGQERCCKEPEDESAGKKSESGSSSSSSSCSCSCGASHSSSEPQECCKSPGMSSGSQSECACSQPSDSPPESESTIEESGSNTAALERESGGCHDYKRNSDCCEALGSSEQHRPAARKANDQVLVKERGSDHPTQHSDKTVVQLQAELKRVTGTAQEYWEESIRLRELFKTLQSELEDQVTYSRICWEDVEKVLERLKRSL